MAAEEAHIVDQRRLACAPQHAHSARIDSARQDSQAAQYVRPTGWRFDHRAGSAHALERRRAVGEIELRQSRMQSNEHRVGLQRERVADDVLPAREIEHAMLIDRLPYRGRVVRFAVSRDAKGVNVHPIA